VIDGGRLDASYILQEIYRVLWWTLFEKKEDITEP